MSSSHRDSLATWLAFAGKAFLSTRKETLLEALSGLQALPAPVPELADAAGRMETALPAGDEAIEQAYVRLFLDPAGAPCPPWQSAHASEPQLMGPAHLSALKWFRGSGVEPRAANEPADHVGLLLAFAAGLPGSATQETLDEYYREHLAWIPAFCDCVAQHAPGEFHGLLAGATKRLVEQFRPVGD